VEESFPRYGKMGDDFSTAWKKVSHFFHTMEKSFPHRGKPWWGERGGERAISSL
jgi:hypothetical protein